MAEHELQLRGIGLRERASSWLPGRREPPGVDENPNFNEVRKSLVLGSITVILTGFTALLLWSTSRDGRPPAWYQVLHTLGAGLSLGLASGSVGAFFGFLFAIPKTNARSTVEQSYEPNTNLEQISDWLTKVLVGLTLAQFSEARRTFAAIVTGAGPLLGETSAAAPFTSSWLILTAVMGFAVAYTVVRLYWAGLLRIADSSMQVTRMLPAVETSLKEGRNQEARQIIETMERNARTPEDESAAYQARILQALYESPPLGFEQAIHLGQLYTDGVRRGQWPDRPEIHMHLACAYAQQHAYATERGQLSALEPIHANTLRELRLAWDAGTPALRAKLLELVRGLPPDDDFRTLRHDPAVLAVVTAGLP